MCIGGCCWFVLRKMLFHKEKKRSPTTFDYTYIVAFLILQALMVRLIFLSLLAWRLQKNRNDFIFIAVALAC